MSNGKTSARTTFRALSLSIAVLAISSSTYAQDLGFRYAVDENGHGECVRASDGQTGFNPHFHAQCGSFMNADLRFLAVPNADYRGANFENAELQAAMLYYANLQGANLQGANLLRVRLRGADLSHASLDRSNLSRSNLTDANLSSACLRGAVLESAALFDANLRGAILVNADLQSAALIRSHLEGADLRSANLTGTYLNGSTYDEHTRFPASFGATESAQRAEATRRGMIFESSAESAASALEEAGAEIRLMGAASEGNARQVSDNTAAADVSELASDTLVQHTEEPRVRPAM